MQAVHSIYREAGERKRDKLSITCSLCLYMFIDKSFQGLFIYQSLLLPSSSTLKKSNGSLSKPIIFHRNRFVCVLCICTQHNVFVFLHTQNDQIECEKNYKVLSHNQAGHPFLSAHT